MAAMSARRSSRRGSGTRAVPDRKGFRTGPGLGLQRRWRRLPDQAVRVRRTRGPLRVLGRRLTRGDRSTSGDLRLDPVRHVLTCENRETELTPTEFRLTGAMIARSGEVIRRREMIAAARPPGRSVHDNTVDVYVRRLRRKLDELESESRIHTVHGVGYRLE